MRSAATTGSHLAIPQVVKVFATEQRPDYLNPWRRQSASNATGSGVVVGPGEILTGAHVVADATFIQLQKIADPNKVVARVKAVCHDSDLALLAVEDERFLRGTAPVPVGELSSLRDHVTVVGFPMGGEEVSITEGVVSRVEVQAYSHSTRSLLAVTIDAAINPGNSGGPVFRDGKVVGIAFQKTVGAEAMGAMVPAPLIRRFLDAAAQGRPAGVPGLGAVVQPLENPELRRRLGMADEESGVLVLKVGHCTSAHGHVEPDDAILEIDGLRVANNGTVRYRDRFRTDFSVVLGDHLIGDELELVVLRAGQRRQLRLTLTPFHPLVPHQQHDRSPTYFIYGGVVFQRLDFDLMNVWTESGPPAFRLATLSRVCTAEQRELVVLGPLLPHAINVGYQTFSYGLVASVNGAVPLDMADFVRLVERSVGRVEIRTADYNELVVFDMAAAAAANREILERYQVDRDRSADLPGGLAVPPD